MSRVEISPAEKALFVRRFVEMCGTAEPSEIKAMLGISYQAAKNYLQGRLPNTDILLSFASRTSYSIHWLLTGDGKKFVESAAPQDTPLPTDQIETIVRTICVEVLNEDRLRHIAAQPNLVKLKPANIVPKSVADSATLDPNEV